MRSLPILLYHHVAPDREIRPVDLEQQLVALLAAGFQSLSLDELLAALKADHSTLPKGFAVTFDDGYLDNWVHAFPVLKKLKVKATAYLVTGVVEERSDLRAAEAVTDTRAMERGAGGFLSWAEAREMQASGLVTFGSHSHTHRHWDRKQAYRNLDEELAQSKALIEKNLGQICRHLAWPWGDFNLSWTTKVRSAGYVSAATVRSGANTKGTDPFRLQRVNVSRADPQWLLRRLALHQSAFATDLFGMVYGLDKRFKVWRKNESPYHA